MNKKLLTLTASFMALTGVISARNVDGDIEAALAASESKTTTQTSMQWGSVPTWGGPTTWKYDTLDPLPSWEELDFYNLNPSEEYYINNTYYQEADEIFAPIYDSLSQEIKDNISDLAYSICNLNYYGTGERGLDISFGFESRTLNSLVYVAEEINASYRIPCLMFDTNTFAVFDVSADGITLVTNDQFVSSVDLVFSTITTAASTSAGDPGDRTRYNYTDVLFHIKPNTLTKISEFEILGYSSLGTHVQFFPKNDQCILPYDVQQFDWNNGELTLSHSIYGDSYGHEYQTKRLASITFEVYAMGERKSYTSTALSQAEYQDYMVSGNYTEEALSTLLKNRFTFGPRFRYDWEPSYGGDMIWMNYFPYQPYDVTKNSEIKILSMSFIDSHENSHFVEATDERKTYNLPDGAITFEYFGDKCLAMGSVEMHEMNMSSTKIVKVDANTWLNNLLFIFNPIAGLITKASYSYFENTLSSGRNIQRFYFNFYDQKKEILDNITKIEFRYQMGNQNPIKEYNSDGTFSVKQDPKLGTPLVARLERTSSTSIEIDADGLVWKSVSFEGNGFVQCDPVELTGEDGTTDLYNYYYQNIYHTEDSTAGKAYYDHISYYSVLSFWYETFEGQCVRLTTDIDGYYLSHDFNGNEKVFNISDPENPTDIDPDDFKKYGIDANETHNYDSGERSDTDKAKDSWDEFWNGILGDASESWNDLKRIIAIAAICIGGILALGIVLRLFGFLGRSFKSFKSGRRK